MEKRSSGRALPRPGPSLFYTWVWGPDLHLPVQSMAVAAAPPPHKAAWYGSGKTTGGKRAL